MKDSYILDSNTVIVEFNSQLRLKYLLPLFNNEKDTVIHGLKQQYSVEQILDVIGWSAQQIVQLKDLG
jgi:uncharacterized protein YccT (UPF0319 family)